MRLFILTLTVGINYQAHAGYIVSDTSNRKFHENSVSIQIGTIGPGIVYNQILSQSHQLTLRIGARYVAYRKPIQIKTAPDSYVRIVPDFAIGTAEAGLKWHPIRQKPLFLTATLGYSWHPDLSFVITTTDKLNLGGLELTSEDIGTIDLGFRWRPIVGYVGWGFARMLPRKRIGVGFEMGVHYLGRPRVRLQYEGFLETTNIDEQILLVERNLSGYRYLPALNLTLTYALNRRQ